MNNHKHFQQSNYWKEVKRESGNQIVDLSFGWLQVTALPFGKKVGYLPPIHSTQINWDELYAKAKEFGCTYVTIDFEDNVNANKQFHMTYDLRPTKSVRLPKNVIIDLDKTEEELLKAIDKKDRYYIRTAEKNGVTVKIDDSAESLETFMKVFLDTKNRKNFLGRGENYIRNVWTTFKNAQEHGAGVKIATAYLNGEVLASWMLIHFENTVYYPYGGSIPAQLKFNPTYLLAWEIIRWSKNNGFKNLDLGGVEANYQGSYSHFKTHFGEVVEYSPSVDLVVDKGWYGILKLGRTLRERVGFIKKFF